MAALMESLQYIYTYPEWNRRIFTLLTKMIFAAKKSTGRPGMSLWEIFVLGQVRLCLDLSYDQLHFMSNDSNLLRGILGVLPTDYNLLWDSARKCIDIAGNLPIGGWRKSKSWKRRLKGLMRATGKASVGGGANKKQRVQTAARALEKKVEYARRNANPVDLAQGEPLDYYHQMLGKHIDLV